MNNGNKRIIKNFVIGFVLFFLFLEIIFQVGSFVSLGLKKHKNKQNLFSSKEYRILCIGESITLGTKESSYPEYLEKILQEKDWGKNIRVINQGVAGAGSGYIGGKIEEWIDAYDPQMVVAMIGLGEGTIEKNKSVIGIRNEKFFWDNIRIVILFRQITSNILEKYFSKEKEGLILKDLSEENENVLLSEFEEEVKKTSSSFQEGYRIAESADKAKRTYVAKAIYKKLLQGNNSEIVNIFLTQRLEEMTKRIEGSNSVLGKLKSAPKGYQDVYKLAIFLGNQKKYVEAEYFLNILIEQDLNDWLTNHMRRMLGQLLEIQGKYKEYTRVMQGLPSDSWGNHWIPKVCSDPEFVEKLREEFLEVARRRPLEDSIYFYLSDCYSFLGNNQQADFYDSKAKGLGFDVDSVYLQKEYFKITEILKKHKISSVYVQYPMSDFKKLFSLFKNYKGVDDIIFVDNEKIFMNAVKKDGRNIYFTTRDQGNTGHLTSRGAQLLAENIARSVEEYLVKGDASY